MGGPLLSARGATPILGMRFLVHPPTVLCGTHRVGVRRMPASRDLDHRSDRETRGAVPAARLPGTRPSAEVVQRNTAPGVTPAVACSRRLEEPSRLTLGAACRTTRGVMDENSDLRVTRPARRWARTFGRQAALVGSLVACLLVASVSPVAAYARPVPDRLGDLVGVRPWPGWHVEPPIELVVWAAWPHVTCERADTAWHAANVAIRVPHSTLAPAWRTRQMPLSPSRPASPTGRPTPTHPPGCG